MASKSIVDQIDGIAVLFGKPLSQFAVGFHNAHNFNIALIGPIQNSVNVGVNQTDHSYPRGFVVLDCAVRLAALAIISRRYSHFMTQVYK